MSQRRFLNRHAIALVVAILAAGFYFSLYFYFFGTYDAKDTILLLGSTFTSIEVIALLMRLVDDNTKLGDLQEYKSTLMLGSSIVLFVTLGSGIVAFLELFKSIKTCI